MTATALRTMPLTSRQIGLVPNNPKHDNGPALTDALRSRRYLHLEPGEYYTSPILIPGGTPFGLIGICGRWIGRSPDKTALVAIDKEQQSIIEVSTHAADKFANVPGNVGAYRPARITDVSFESDGNKSTDGEPYGHGPGGVIIANGILVVIERCDFTNCADGVVVEPNPRICNVNIRDCYFRRCDCGVWSSGRGPGGEAGMTVSTIRIDGCYFSECYNSIAAIRGFPCLSIQSTTAQASLHRELVLQGSRATIRDSYLENHGIRVRLEDDKQTGSELIAENCVLGRVEVEYRSKLREGYGCLVHHVPFGDED